MNRDMTNATADRHAHQRLALPFGVESPATRTSARLELAPLNTLAGRWLTEGETRPHGDSLPLRVLSSDVYEWAPGGHFLLHHTRGRIGDAEVGAVEVIGYDRATRQFRAQVFDHSGNVYTQSLTHRDGTWTWRGVNTRSIAVLSDGDKTMMATHEHSDDGIVWVPSMQIIRWKVD
jgi:hypothetical protein